MPLLTIFPCHSFNSLTVRPLRNCIVAFCAITLSAYKPEGFAVLRRSGARGGI